ncbi:MAG TPA: SPOR domain-containing protein, partial [Saprospiraceae bacterium]|nr:SPOR domain-containing protein [Saprospiraceae bacterium]
IAFTKDADATSKYVSTRMDVGDFDGGIFFDLLDLEETPSWVILYPDGTEKERWEGGWKDVDGNPTPFSKEMTTTVSQKQKSASTVPASTSTSSSTDKIETVSPSVTNVSKSNTNVQSGYFLQAGYFGSEANAMKLVSDLKTKGFNDFEIKKEMKDGAAFYRVVSKIFKTETEINSEQKRIEVAGVKTSVKMM